MRSRLFSLLLLLWAAAPTVALAQTGYQPNVAVSAPTRLDWQFVVRDFPEQETKLPPKYDSRRQHYALYVPKNYNTKKAWPLVLFLSWNDQPAGWEAWQKLCETRGILFCSPYAAGNGVPAGQRLRTILDVFDDVRRRYRTDPDQTYVAGFSGGGRIACTLAYALPEHFAGVIAVCGTNPPPRLTALRHRLHDRLSVAFVTGETDFNRKENEVYMYPWFQELRVRSRLWVVPKMRHVIPHGSTFAEVYTWLTKGLERCRRDARTYPSLAIAPGAAPDAEQQAKDHLQAAEADLKKPERVWRGVALLQEVKARWATTQAGEAAQKRLKRILADNALLKRVEEQGGADERLTLMAQAKALERFGQIKAALQAYELLVQHHRHTHEGRAALAAIKRLRGPDDMP